jgi:hypothetical protein
MSIFNSIFGSKIKTLHTCAQSRLSVMAGDGACLAYGENEDEGISDLPNGFQCTLPDGSAWAVKSRAWVQVSMAKQAKASTVAGGASW